MDFGNDRPSIEKEIELRNQLSYYKGVLVTKQQNYEDALQRLHKFKRALENIRDEQIIDGQGVVDLDNALTQSMRNIAIEALT